MIARLWMDLHREVWSFDQRLDSASRLAYVARLLMSYIQERQYQFDYSLADLISHLLFAKSTRNIPHDII